MYSVCTSQKGIAHLSTCVNAQATNSIIRANDPVQFAPPVKIVRRCLSLPVMPLLNPGIPILNLQARRLTHAMQRPDIMQGTMDNTPMF